MSRYALSDINRLYERVSAVQLIHILDTPEAPMSVEALHNAEKALFEEITPEFVYVLRRGDVHTRPAIAWAAEAAELREWLEDDIAATVWKVSRTDPTDSTDCTDDFARQWINDRGDFHEGFEDFLHKLGPWLSTYYDELARDMYADAQVRDGD